MTESRIDFDILTTLTTLTALGPANHISVVSLIFHQLFCAGKEIMCIFAA